MSVFCGNPSSMHPSAFIVVVCALCITVPQPSELKAQWVLGVGLADFDARPHIPGITIAEVVVGDPAHRVGIESGDIVFRIDGLPVYTVADVQHAIAASRGQTNLSVRDWRTGRISEIQVLLKWMGLQPIQPPDLAQIQVNEITQYLGMPPIPTRRASIPYAEAIVEPDQWGQPVPVILYSPEFLSHLFVEHGRWASISVLAHEVAHHFHGDSSFFGAFQHPWTKELKADYVSGFVLAKGGASEDQATRALRDQFSHFGTVTHPDTPKRIAALAAGWRVGKMGP